MTLQELLEELAGDVGSGTEPAKAVRNYVGNAPLAQLAALSLEIAPAAKAAYRTFADIEAALVLELESAILEASDGSACEREDWCCRQVGHPGACLPNFT